MLLDGCDAGGNYWRNGVVLSFPASFP